YRFRRIAVGDSDLYGIHVPVRVAQADGRLAVRGLVQLCAEAVQHIGNDEEAFAADGGVVGSGDVQQFIHGRYGGRIGEFVVVEFFDVVAGEVQPFFQYFELFFRGNA